MAASVQSTIAKLKHKDIRQRRRAVRVLFDSDIHESVEAFSKFLNDKDIWFRNKAIEAYRRWAPKHAPHLLIELAKGKETDGHKCVSSVLRNIQDLKLAEELARLLLLSDDSIVKRNASVYLIDNEFSSSEEEDSFLISKDPVIKSASLAVTNDIPSLQDALSDSHPDVRKQAGIRMLEMNLSKEEESLLNTAISNDTALWKLAVPKAMKEESEHLISLAKGCTNSQRRFFVATMREHIHEADDDRINTLLAEDCTSLVSRWLVGRNDSKSDVLRETLLFDERVDSIDKSRLLERILHRQNEVLIQELAQKVLEQSSDEVVLSAARNLSTVTDEPSS
ncbi:MAG: hypothetical protein ISR25_00320 [Candidatus Poseidoniaceae archaeon]|nr:hypothetical protein [Candidatus Poseidoniaceae archaeon]MBL6888919.1 hypothetical protein [Candidatus Poseidoniaceae archaeon]